MEKFLLADAAGTTAVCELPHHGDDERPLAWSVTWDGRLGCESYFTGIDDDDDELDDAA